MKLTFILLSSFCLISCSSFESSLKRASRLSEKNKDQEALNLTVKALGKAKNNEQKEKALRFIADICERKLKDYSCAINSYNELLSLSTSKKLIESYHYKIGDIYFLHLQDYENALTNYSEVVENCQNSKLCMESKVKISRSYYYKREFQQAINEIESLIQEQKSLNPIVNKTRFVEASILHSQALMGLGKYTEAVVPLFDTLDLFRDEANKQQVPILIAVAYRENSEYQKALDILKVYKEENKDPVSDVFIDGQIEKLERRLELQPGGPSGTQRRR